MLLVRMKYGPTRGQYMFPGGVVDPGETIDQAIAREVREETGVDARPVAIAGVLSVVYQVETHTYILWMMAPVTGEPVADNDEVDDCLYLSFDDVQERDDVADLVRYVVRSFQSGGAASLVHRSDYPAYLPGLDDTTFKLFM